MGWTTSRRLTLVAQRGEPLALAGGPLLVVDAVREVAEGQRVRPVEAGVRPDHLLPDAGERLRAAHGFLLDEEVLPDADPIQCGEGLIHEHRNPGAEGRGRRLGDQTSELGIRELGEPLFERGSFGGDAGHGRGGRVLWMQWLDPGRRLGRLGCFRRFGGLGGGVRRPLLVVEVPAAVMLEVAPVRGPRRARGARPPGKGAEDEGAAEGGEERAPDEAAGRLRQHAGRAFRSMGSAWEGERP